MEKEFQELFQIRHNDDRVEVGKVLIAEPFLEGKYFNRSVVYMVEYDENGKPTRVDAVVVSWGSC